MPTSGTPFCRIRTRHSADRCLTWRHAPVTRQAGSSPFRARNVGTPARSGSTLIVHPA